MESANLRSRSGCVTCRRKHRKCDEGQPKCQACQIRGLECDYKTPLRWTAVGSVSKVRQNTKGSGSKLRGCLTGTTRGGTKSPAPNESPTTLPELPELGYLDQERPPSPPNNLEISPSQRFHITSQPVQQKRDGRLRDILREDASPLECIVERGRHLPSSRHRIASITLPQNLEATSKVYRYLNSQQSILQGRRDELRNEGSPSQSISGTDHDHRAQSSHESLFYHYPTDGNSPIREENELPFSTNAEARSPTISTSWMVDNTMRSLLFQLFQSPDEEIAFTYFFKRVCTCIPAHDSERNPWRKLAMVSLSYPVLLHGVLSVATAHMHNCGRSNVSLLSSRQSRALHSLQAALNALQANREQDGEADSSSRNLLLHGSVFSILSATEIALAAVMMQTSSVLMSGAGNVEMHLKCALHFIQDIGYLSRPPSSTFSRTLVNRFAMVDVVHAHLRFQRPLASLDFIMYQDNVELDLADPPFWEMHGCHQRVLCFLAKIAALSADLLDGSSTHELVQAKAYTLETEMRIWGQRYHSEMIRDPSFNSTTATHTSASPQSTNQHSRRFPNEESGLDIVCECFYWTAQLLLLRRLFLDPTESSRVQLIRRHLFQLMDRLEPGCGPDSSLPFPFYITAREATTLQERDWVRRKHIGMMEVYRDRSREYMMESTEKIWNNAVSVKGQPVSDDIPPWCTPREKFIRELDKSATYFMF